MLFHLCTTLISSSGVCISCGHPRGYLCSAVCELRLVMWLWILHRSLCTTVCSTRWLLLYPPASGTSSCDRMGTGAQIWHQHWGAFPLQHIDALSLLFISLPEKRWKETPFPFCKAAWTMKLWVCINLFLWAVSDHGFPASLAWRDISSLPNQPHSRAVLCLDGKCHWYIHIPSVQIPSKATVKN